MIDAEIVRQLIRYDAETGVFTWLPRERSHFSRDNQWRNWNARYPGEQAGTIRPNGYRFIALFGRQYAAHRLAWLYVHGVWPTNQIDHINGDRDDNKITNLRDVPNAENARNRSLQARSKTGRVGVTEYAFGGRQQRFAARIRVDGRLRHLGYFETIEEASAARERAEAEYGFHVNHGRASKTKFPLKSRGFARRWPA